MDRGNNSEPAQDETQIVRTTTQQTRKERVKVKAKEKIRAKARVRIKARTNVINRRQHQPSGGLHLERKNSIGKQRNTLIRVRTGRQTGYPVRTG